MAKRKATSSAKGKSLVIVESPAKAKTINKYLGDGFVVKASMGHVRDLPQHDFGIDTENDFTPNYEVVPARSKVIAELSRLAAVADDVYLASDRDREGEAIAWHLVHALNLPPEKVKRVIFNEITRSAIQEAFDHPHEIDIDRVNAQQARRILDRIVGYQLSPLLWNKIAKGLSAGRVQSVTVRLIVEREREIRAFEPVESWKVVAYVTGDEASASKLSDSFTKYLSKRNRTQKDIQDWLRQHGAFRTELAEVDGEPFRAENAEEARAVVEALGYRVDEIEREPWEDYKHLNLELAKLVGGLDRSNTSKLVVSKVTTKRTKPKPYGPFTTATLQQSASNVLSFSALRTMRVAQKLYEGMELPGEGTVGLITYMRTDSTHLSAEALSGVRSYIEHTFGKQYLPEKPNFYGKRQARTQEAHEAVRPTDPHRTPESVRGVLESEQFKLYELIWKRFTACQMPPAEWDSTSVSVSCETSLGTARFAGTGRTLVFDGFLKVMGVSTTDQILPELTQGEPAGLIDLEPKQQYTSPPPRYTEASLVKKLEAEGIGRPSTYASIIETIQKRGYVDQEDRKFFASALGEIVTDKLVQHFPKILDVKFTSYMEDEFDKIEEAHLDWVKVLHEFYDPFKALLEKAGVEMEAARSQPSDHACPQCNEKMVYRWSKLGRFLSCTTFPKCKGSLNVNRDGEPIVADGPAQTCELCGKTMVLRQSRGGFFLGCGGYPDCRNTLACDSNGVALQIVAEEDLKQPCEACGKGTMVVKWKRMSAFLGCDRYPKCKNTGKVAKDISVKRKPAPPPEEAGVPCEKCKRPMVIRVGSRGKFIACSGFPKCRNTKPIEKLADLQAEVAESGEKVMTLAEYSASVGAKSSAGGNGKGKKVDIAALGDPPAGFAWTRTGRPVVETMPEEGTLICPDCKNVMGLRRGRFGPFFSCTGFPKCRFVSNLRGQAKKDAEELMPAPERPKPIPT